MFSKKNARYIIYAVLILIIIFAARYFISMSEQDSDSFSGNGRLEATEVDISTKTPGRVVEIIVREGDNLTAGQLAARLEVDDIAAQLRAAESTIEQAKEAAKQARNNLNAAISQQKLASVTAKRTKKLVDGGYATSQQQLDIDMNALKTANSALAAAKNRVSEADAAIKTATAQAEMLRVNVRDAELRSPIAGRVIYRLAEPGTFLGAGGKVVTLLDLSDVYMSIYLPSEEAGKISMGSPAKIVLDALPDKEIPAKVIFVAPRSQFTPKEVETKNEREKLMFRIKVKVNEEWIKENADLAKPGMPGVAYISKDNESSDSNKTTSK